MAVAPRNAQGPAVAVLAPRHLAHLRIFAKAAQVWVKNLKCRYGYGPKIGTLHLHIQSSVICSQQEIVYIYSFSIPAYGEDFEMGMIHSTLP